MIRDFHAPPEKKDEHVIFFRVKSAIKGAGLVFIFLLIISMALLPVGVVWGALEPPPAPAARIYIQDYADLVDENTEANILRLGEQLDRLTTAQLVVVTINNLQGYPISDFANELFRKWGIGSKKFNNGVLLLVARDERQVRVEVGYGLEGALPDSITGRILDERVVPFFKKGDYSSGILGGYTELAQRVAGEYGVALDSSMLTPVPKAPSVTENQQKVDIPWWMPLMVLFLIVMDFVLNRGRITRFLINILFWVILLRGGRGGGGGFGGGGGLGGGSSGGGGSNRGW